jgi:hypothetical protein
MSEEVKVTGDGLSEELVRLRERQLAVEARLGGLERSVDAMLVEIRKISTLLRGNGEHGLVTRIERAHERIEALQGQWRWMAGLLAALVLASVKSMLWD